MRMPIALTLVLLLNACAVVSQVQQRLAPAPSVTTASYADMVATPVLPEQRLSVTLAPGTPQFQFATGSSYYAMLALPPAASARRLGFRSFFNDSYLPQADVLFPSFTLLDAARQPIATLKRERGGAMDSDLLGNPYFQGEVVIPPQAAYVVVHSDGKATPPLSARANDGTLYSIAHAQTGKLSLSLSQPYPAGYDFATALIRDSATVHGAQLIDLFYVASIDGKAIVDSRSSTQQANAGRGGKLTPVLDERESSVNLTTYSLVGRSEYATSLLALTKPVYEVKGELKAALLADHRYVVRGELGEQYSAVWLEDEDEHRIVGDKIEIHGSARLGILSK